MVLSDVGPCWKRVGGARQRLELTLIDLIPVPSGPWHGAPCLGSRGGASAGCRSQPAIRGSWFGCLAWQAARPAERRSWVRIAASWASGAHSYTGGRRALDAPLLFYPHTLERRRCEDEGVRSGGTSPYGSAAPACVECADPRRHLCAAGHRAHADLRHHAGGELHPRRALQLRRLHDVHVGDDCRRELFSRLAAGGIARHRARRRHRVRRCCGGCEAPTSTPPCW